MASSGNFCTINPVGAQGGGTTSPSALSSGNTAVTMQTDTVFGNFGVTSGKWYWEWALTGSSNSGQAVGWANQQVNPLAELGYNSPSSATGAQIVYMYLSPSSGAKDIISDAPKSASSGTDSDSTGSVVQNDIISLAADFDNDKWYFAINGSYTAMRSGQNPSDGSNPMCSASGGGGLVTIARTAGYIWFPAMGNWAAGTRNIKVNFGQDSTFSGSFSAGGNADENGFGDFKYSVPTGFLAMCSANLPISDDIDPAQTDDNFPQKNFNAVIYDSTGSGQSITGVGFQPDLVWIKCRSVDQGNGLFDSTRGTGKVLQSNDTNAENTSSGVTSFDSDGYSMGTYYNQSGREYVSWCWRANGGTTTTNTDGATSNTLQANQAAGFSISQFSNSSGATTIGHGLGVAPAFYVIKIASGGGGSWGVYHKSLGATKYIRFNSNSGSATASNYFNDTEPTSTVLSVGSTWTGTTIMCYAWADVEGFQRFGSYAGNGNADGTFVYTGFGPRMLFLKRTDSSGSWHVLDTARNTKNAVDTYLLWDTGGTDDTASSNSIDFLSNGFKIRNNAAGLNTSGGDYVYGAWGDVPFKYNNSF